MGFFSLLTVASMPVLQVLLIGILGAFLASGYANILTPSARRDMNKVAFYAFTPSLIFASISKTVTLRDLISWWFMPVNVAILFLIGGVSGWIVVKILRPPRHLEGLIIACCTAGNLGNLMVILVPAVCNEEGSPFGESSICNLRGLSYASLSMALGSFFIWTHTYSLMRKAGLLYAKIRNNEEVSKIADKSSDRNEEVHFIKVDDEENYANGVDSLPPTTKTSVGVAENQITVPLLSHENKEQFWEKVKGTLLQIGEELTSPPNVAAITGFIIGLTPWLKSLLIGDTAPLRVIQDSIKLLGDGTIPCITLILGGNLTQGIRKLTLRPMLLIAIVCIRYVILPIAGIAVVKAAGKLGFLPADPLFSYVLMLQFTLSPAMNIGTMAQLFDVGQEECSVIFLWTYLAAAPMITMWSTVYMWILS